MLQEQVFKSDAFLQEGTKECERSMPTLIASTTHSITRFARADADGRVVSARGKRTRTLCERTHRFDLGPRTLGSPKSTDFIWSILCLFIVAVGSPRPSASATLCCRSTNERHEPPICCAVFRRRTLVHVVHPHLRVSLAPLSDFCSWQLFGDK